jgi:hypothetical protein
MKWSNVDKILDGQNNKEQKALKKIKQFDKIFIVLIPVVSFAPAVMLFYLLWAK